MKRDDRDGEGTDAPTEMKATVRATMTLQGGREYRKFMVDDAIDPALLPLDVWNALFEQYQNKPGNFYKGFKRLGVLRLDVEQEVKKAEAEGKWLTEDEAAREVLYEVIDELGNDMWYQRAMSLVEEDCRKDVAWRPKNYAKYLDPIYDEQETRGWQPYWEPVRWVLPGSEEKVTSNK